MSLTSGCISLTTNKSFEWQFEFGGKFATDLFEFSLQWTLKGDHAGLGFTFSLYKLFWIELQIYDVRHWDYEKDCWES